MGGGGSPLFIASAFFSKSSSERGVVLGSLAEVKGAAAAKRSNLEILDVDKHFQGRGPRLLGEIQLSCHVRPPPFAPLRARSQALDLFSTTLSHPVFRAAIAA